MFSHHTRLVALALAVFVLLGVAHTWPLAAAPGHWSRLDNGDGALNTWAVSWVGTQLWQDPRHVFDANIFYPERSTLAYSEAMLLQGVIASPVLALGGSPVLAYNVVLLAGFAFTGWAFCLLLHHWTGSWSAGYLAGSLAAFNAHTLVRIPQLQAFHTEFVAVMLFALDRVIRDRRVRDAFWLAVAFALQGLASIYLLVFSTWMLLFATLARTVEWVRSGATATITRLAAAGVTATVLLVPYLWPYQRLHSGMGFSRAPDEESAARWVDYLATGGRLHHAWWSKPFADQSTSYAFPGILAVLLVAVAVSDRATRRDPRFRMCAVAAAGCVAVSLVPLLPWYPTIHRLVPLFQAIRSVAHIGQVVLLMVAVMAGFGLAALGRRFSGWVGAVLAVTIVVGANGEALRAPLLFTPFEGVPGVYDVLAREAPGVVVELPFPPPRQWFLNGRFMVNSTRHWRPLLNGYSGFRPPSYAETYEALRGFPSDASLMGLYARQVAYVVVHEEGFAREQGEGRLRQIAGVHSLQQIAHEGDIAIYRLLTP